MKLYKLNASDWRSFFGTPEASIARNAIAIGQAPDCSSFLIMTTELAAYLIPAPDLAQFDFVYCQAWGLRITPEVVQRAWADNRAKNYPAFGDQLDALWKGGADAAAMLVLINAVKTKFPKLVP